MITQIENCQARSGRKEQELIPARRQLGAAGETHSIFTHGQGFTGVIVELHQDARDTF